MKKKRKQTNDRGGKLNNNIDAYRKAGSTFHNSMYRLAAAIVDEAMPKIVIKL